MKQVGIIAISIALGFVTNLVSNYVTNYAKKRKTFFWSVFVMLIAGSIILVAWPDPPKQAAISVVEAKIDYDSFSAPYSTNDKETYCAQSVRIANNGESITTIASVKAILSFRGQQFLASASRTGVHNFEPNKSVIGLSNITLFLMSSVGDSSYGEIPRRIEPGSVLDILLQVAFEYDLNDYESHSLFSSRRDPHFDLIDLTYTLITADGTEIATKQIPCYFLKAKTVIKAP